MASEGFKRPRLECSTRARGLSLSTRGKLTIENSPGITCCLSQEDLADPLFLRNVIQGTIITGQLYPIVTDERLQLLQEMSETMEVDEKVRGAVRDLFVAASRQLLSDEEQTIFSRALECFDARPMGTLLEEGLEFCSCPTRRFKKIRWITQESMNQHSVSQFLHCQHGFIAVFVDPKEMSFHCFENIVPLDNAFTDQAVSFQLKPISRPHAGVELYQLKGATHFVEAIGNASELYVAPSNSRGGKRFIFHSASLADALTKAVRERLDESRTSNDTASFSHVNPVFRMNWFDTGDDPFHLHLDTPYYDRARQHVSKQTLLLYLTGGMGEPALKILTPAPSEEVVLREIQAFTCLIMDQSLRHEGMPFVDGPKIFLRTELIFHISDDEISRHPLPTQLFASACYLEAESVFHEELIHEAEARYEAANKWRFGGCNDDSSPLPPLRLLKATKDVAFVTDGYNYWFRPDQDLRICALLAVCDFLNVLMTDGWGNRRPFRDIVASTRVSPPKQQQKGNIASLLDGVSGARNKSRRLDPVIVKDLDDIREGLDKALPSFIADEKHCCPFHRWDCFHPSKNVECIESFERAKSMVLPFLRTPVLVLGKKVLLDPRCVVLDQDRLYVMSDAELPPVAFAACWNCNESSMHYVEPGEKVSFPKLLCPPILFTQSAASGLHLMLDFFRNDWYLKETRVEKQVALPRFSRRAEQHKREGTYFFKAMDAEYDSEE